MSDVLMIDFNYIYRFLWESTWNKHVVEVHTRPCGMPNVDDLPSDPDEQEDVGKDTSDFNKQSN